MSIAHPMDLRFTGATTAGPGTTRVIGAGTTAIVTGDIMGLVLLAPIASTAIVVSGAETDGGGVATAVNIEIEAAVEATETRIGTGLLASASTDAGAAT